MRCRDLVWYDGLAASIVYIDDGQLVGRYEIRAKVQEGRRNKTTFGHANTFNRDAPGSVNFQNWSQTPIWRETEKGKGICIGNLPGSVTSTLDNPSISEAGRKFLADLLVQLSDTQLHDLFDVARFTRRDPKASIEDWVQAFKHKRDEIVNRTCSS